MMNSGDETGPQPKSFASLAIQWDVANYGRWLRAGLDAWFHPRATPGERAVAFRPLVLNPDRDPVSPLADAVETIPGGLERLRDAGSEALAIWTGHSGHAGAVLDALLRLAKRLPAASHVAALRRLLFEGHLNGEPLKELLALRALEAAAELIALSEGEALLRELRGSKYWQPSFAATWLEGMARARKIGWLEGLLELRGDLKQIDPEGQNLQPVVRRMAERAGRAAEVRDRLQAIAWDDPWLGRVLFQGSRPALDVIERRGFKRMRTPAIVVGGEFALLQDERDEPAGSAGLFSFVLRSVSEKRAQGQSRPKRARDPQRGHGRTAEELANILAGDEFFRARALPVYADHEP